MILVGMEGGARWEHEGSGVARRVGEEIPVESVREEHVDQAMADDWVLGGEESAEQHGEGRHEGLEGEREGVVAERREGVQISHPNDRRQQGGAEHWIDGEFLVDDPHDSEDENQTYQDGHPWIHTRITVGHF